MSKLSWPFTPQIRIALIAALFLMLTGNVKLFERLLDTYPLTLANTPFLLSLTLFFTLGTMLFLVLVTPGRVGRWILIFLLVASAQTAYYMDHFASVIDSVMLENVLATDIHEATGLMSWSLAWRTVVFGLIPAWLVWRYWPKSESLWREIVARLGLAMMLIAALVLVAAPFTAGYASFIREHKMVRRYANPTFFVSSIFSLIGEKLHRPYTGPLLSTAPDAHLLNPDRKKNLVIVVVGETARADRFSLNGYARPTNPLLAQEENAVSMTAVTSCGTSTNYSVPCMFSVLGRKHFSIKKAEQMENALDVLARLGVQILWRDNNSDSKGVATRVPYQNFKTSTHNPVCTEMECRDIGLLDKLDDYVASKKGQDMLIVLHQRGNHGPEYYLRYPKEFERFTPTCKDRDLRMCSQEEIDNAYDNAVLYTDYFLSEVIKFLKKHDDEYGTAMLYVSDHGESLGEYGIYLHATPYEFAPKEQTHVPGIIWLGTNFGYSAEQLKPLRDTPVSQDDMFCALLAGFEVGTKTCEGARNILPENLDLKRAGIAPGS
ncbi:MAG: phosphoethanolamine--lipid A transferase [Methylobacillus sp.]|jgi:lipid A ethanolaminephosphotransferase|nr:phosphoethanolamine--lipid A transferase [Methylobacillus sp.]